MRYIAFVTKGLESVAEREITTTIPRVSLITAADKRLIFDGESVDDRLASLRTVDDICLLAGEMFDLKGSEDVLSALDHIDLQPAREIIARQRKVDLRFSITPTILGMKSTSSRELVEAVSKQITSKYGWVFSETDHSNFDIRVFIERSVGYIAVRLTEQSLVHRSYRTASQFGALRSTVAAAMIQLATASHPNLQLVDNFCGSGTILCEAVVAGHRVYGGDLDPASVSVAKSNLTMLDYTGLDRIRTVDATKSKWPSNHFDSAVSNLPWGKQIALTSVTTLYDRALDEYSRIVRKTGTVCVLVSKPELLMKYARKHFPGAKISATRISFTGQIPTIVLIQRDAGLR